MCYTIDMTLTPIESLVQLLLTQSGDGYVYGAKESSLIANPGADRLPFDCSGLVAWGTGRLGHPLLGSSGEQYAQCASAGLAIPVDKARATRGALLFVQPDTHVAMSLGNGMTIEARGIAYGVGSWSSSLGRDFNAAALIPGFDYTEQDLDMPLTNADVALILTGLDNAAKALEAGNPTAPGVFFLETNAKRVLQLAQAAAK